MVFRQQNAARASADDQGISWPREEGLPLPRRLGLAALFFLIALALRLEMFPLDAGVPYITFFPAVLLAVLFCGLGPGLLVVLLSAATGLYWDRYALTIQVPASITFIVASLVICLVVHRMHRARALMRQALQAARAAEQEAILLRNAARQAEAEAERANLAKSKFLAAASHDLRQPVQSLALLLEVLKTQAATPAVERAVRLMEAALEGLTGLLGSLLDIARLDAGVVAPQFLSFDLAALIDRLGSEYGVVCQSKGLTLRSRPGQPLIIHSDPVLVERLLRNLIENAIRYTPSGGLLLGLRHRQGTPRVDVIDTGIGIAPVHQRLIFDEFYQVGNPGRDRQLGLGLGLSIVRRVAQLIGAEITLSSRPGRGSRFSLLLPPGEEANG
jgi:signal transduction histidine kinase